MLKILGGILIIGAIGVGAFLWQGKQAEAPTPEAAGSAMMGSENETRDRGIVGSIREAMGMGKTMQCTYVVDGGKPNQMITSTVVVEGTKFQSTTTTPEATVFALFDGENQYSWMSNTKQGMKLSKACLEKMKTAVQDLPNAAVTTPQPQDMQTEFDKAKNVQCETGGALNLTLPTDITFTDQCALMEQSLKMMEQFKNKLPADSMPIAPNMAY